MPEQPTKRTSLADILRSLIGRGEKQTTDDSSKPMPAVEPRGTAPAMYSVPTGQNLNVTPRSGWKGALTAFGQIRSLSDYDLCRLAIADVSGQIRGMDWEVVPNQQAMVRQEVPAAVQAQVDAAVRWLEYPDPLARLSWDAWLSAVLEEILVTDALTLLPRRSVSGEFIGLEQVDGASILPLVDDRGRPPLPPLAAYQQIKDGRPDTEFSIDELWYLPRNRRPDNPYGRSPVETVLFTVNLAIRQDLSDLAYHTGGNIPDSLFGVPSTWSQKQIEDFQVWFDTVLTGREDRRSGNMRFVPDGKYMPTKEHVWQYEYREWLGRVICWAFGVSPLPIAKMNNRSTSEVQEMSTTESGVKPIVSFVATIVNLVLHAELGLEDVEFRWSTEQIEDPQVVYQRDVAYVAAGIFDRNEVRARLGMEPIEEEAPKPVPPQPPQPEVVEEEDVEDVEPDAVEPEEAEKRSANPMDVYFEAARRDFAAYRRAMAKRAKQGKPSKPFVSDLIPVASRERMEAGR